MKNDFPSVEFLLAIIAILLVAVLWGYAAIASAPQRNARECLIAWDIVSRNTDDGTPEKLAEFGKMYGCDEYILPTIKP